VTRLDIKLENYDEKGAIFRGDYKKKEIFLITEIKKGETRDMHLIHNFEFIDGVKETLFANAKNFK